MATGASNSETYSTRLKILFVHNRYQFDGGEDEVVERERQLLVNAGHKVVEYNRDNREINGYTPIQRAGLALRTIWAWDSHRDVARLLQTEKPDVVHCHNTFPLVSPAVYYACAGFGVPVVQTLYNPRLICPAATLYRDGSECQECVARSIPWPAVRHACYRDSYSQSAVVSSMLVLHRWAQTWQQKIAVYLVATEFYRQKLIEGGLPADKIVVKPHFLSADPGVCRQQGDYALFVGRLAREKGVRCLLAAWKNLAHIPLKIRGDGPLADEVKEFARSSTGNVEVIPRLPREALYRLIKGARFLVWPSEGLYETFGLVAIEAFACGIPILTSGSGAMQEIVEDGLTGLHFRPGDPVDLRAKARWAWEHLGELEEIGRAGRAEFEAKYRSDCNYDLLIDIYRRAIRQQISQPR